MTTKVLYVCDRLACKECSSECRHTTDPMHAKNVTRDDPDRFDLLNFEAIKTGFLDSEFGEIQLWEVEKSEKVKNKR